MYSIDPRQIKAGDYIKLSIAGSKYILYVHDVQRENLMPRIYITYFSFSNTRLSVCYHQTAQNGEYYYADYEEKQLFLKELRNHKILNDV